MDTPPVPGLLHARLGCALRSGFLAGLAAGSSWCPRCWCGCRLRWSRRWR